MKVKFFTMLFAVFLMASSALAQTSWLDRPLTNWNPTTGIVPNAPRATGDSPTISRCPDAVRSPESLADRALTRVGWSLFGASQTYGPVTLINAMASIDGMCRPNQYNTFIFVSNRFTGTLSPTVMNSRNDGALSEARLTGRTDISAEFTRYTSSDALCCPSQTSFVIYSITNGRVVAGSVETEATCPQSQNEPIDQIEEGVVRGTVTYRQRGGSQRNATLAVRLVDITLTSAPAITIGEQRMEITNQQPPIPFEIKVNPNRIDERRKYALQAELSVTGRTIFVTDKVYPVLTQGNPHTAEINLVSLNSIGNLPSGNTTSLLQGTINYRERISLPNNAGITVKLIDGSSSDSAANAAAIVVAETTFSSNGRQVPIPFELRYNPNQIDSRRNYFLQAEISTDGKPTFVTNTKINVVTQGNPTDNLQILLVPARQTALAIIGQTLSLSKFGTGSLQVEGKNSTFLVRAAVEVKADGNADVTFSGITGGIIFSGKLVYFDQNTLRIMVENSGNADAGGEIEVKYNGRRLDSITGNNLVLDGQKVTLSF